MQDGVLLAIAEAKDWTRPQSHPAWIGGPGRWQPFFSSRPNPAGRRSDAAALPDGSVLVLERWYLPVLGFRSRLSVLPGGGDRGGPCRCRRRGRGGRAGAPRPGRPGDRPRQLRRAGDPVAPKDGGLELLIVSDGQRPP